MSFWDRREAKILFKELPFYNALIEKPYTDLLHELSFCDELNIVKTSKAFRGYARSYNIEIIDSNVSFNQLTISKSSIRDLFKVLLYEIKSFKMSNNTKSFVMQIQRT